MSNGFDGFRCEILEDQFSFDLERFASRDPGMNAWLANHALDYVNHGYARVWVLTPTRGDTGVVAGFFALSNFEILRGDVPRGLLQEGGGKTLSQRIPATLLGKFAVAREFEGSGVSDILMYWVNAKVLEASKIAASKFLVVELRDSDQTCNFLDNYYQTRFGFSTLARAEDGISDSLARSVDDIAADLEKISVF